MKAPRKNAVEILNWCEESWQKVGDYQAFAIRAFWGMNVEGAETDSIEWDAEDLQRNRWKTLHEHMSRGMDLIQEIRREEERKIVNEFLKAADGKV